jgi:hypothetical protein
VLVIGAVLLAACGAPPLVDDRDMPTPPGAVTGGAPAGQPSAAARQVLRWTFDDGDVLSALTGPAGAPGAAQVSTANGGEVRSVVPGADGSEAALGFPAVCDGDACPRVLVEGPDHPDLDPGAAPFVLGVSVQVRPDQLSREHGSNLVQKGISTTAQWKLQIDDTRQGRPSCVLRGPAGADEVVVRSRVSVADGQWHRIACRRTANSAELIVDDEVVGTAAVPQGLSVEPAGQRLAIGAKGSGRNNDQFHGALDDVFFALE